MDRPVHSPLRRAASIAGLVAVVLFLTSCFRAEFNFEISDDGTADIVLVTVIDTGQLEELAGLLGEDTTGLDLEDPGLFDELTGGENPCGDIAGDLADYQVDIEEISDGSEVGVRCTVREVPLSELSDVGDDSSLRIEQTDAGTRFDATLDGIDELTGGTDGLDGLDLGAIPGFDVDEIFSIEFNVSAPGSLGDNNASSTSGSTATWTITAGADFVTNGQAVMTAEWTPGSSGSNTWIIVVVIAALVAIAVAVFFVLRSRPSTPATATGEPGATPSAPPPPPPGSTPPPPPAGTAPGSGPPSASPPTAPPPPPPASSPPPPPPPTSSEPPPPPPA